MLSINYILEDAGWATVVINNGEQILELNVSYLHDSLKNLAESAIELKKGNEKSVVFMDEPGEHWLILKIKENEVINYELRWYEDWTNWNLISEEKYIIKLQGNTTISKYINEVRINLQDIYEKHGYIEYKKRWIQDDFPLDEFEKLK